MSGQRELVLRHIHECLEATKDNDRVEAAEIAGMVARRIDPMKKAPPLAAYLIYEGALYFTRRELARYQVPIDEDAPETQIDAFASELQEKYSVMRHETDGTSVMESWAYCKRDAILLSEWRSIQRKFRKVRDGYDRHMAAIKAFCQQKFGEDVDAS